MKLLSMTATFGCLDGETLELHEGVNLLTMPNERGKSTWAAFLTAMFYGIDTTRRASRGSLPEKLRYQPWNGKAMSGTVELEHQGQTIVLQRTSQRGRPMSVFQAYDKQTGLALPELTGENCGTYFFGVERAVFLRSALLSGGELAVTEDRELARRLENLAASGDSGDSYPAAEARLRQWKNKVRYHQSGQLPETQAALEQLEQQISAVTALRQQAQTAAEARDRCLTDLQSLEQAEAAAWRQRKEQARARYRAALDRMEQAEGAGQTAMCGHLPDHALLELRDQLRDREQDPRRPEPPCPPELAGLEPEQLTAQAHQLAAKQTRQRRQQRLWGIFPVLLLAAGLLALRPVWQLGAALLAAACTAAVLWLHRRRQRNATPQTDWLAEAALRRQWLSDRARWDARDQRLEALLAQYGETASPDTLTALDVEQLLTGGRDAARALAAAEAEYQAAAAPPVPGAQLVQKRQEADRLEAHVRELEVRERASGDLEQLCHRRDKLLNTQEALLLREQALTLAQEALAQAHSQLEQVYTPQLTRLAGTYLAELTRGRYDTLLLEKSWQLHLREQESGLIRPLGSLSSGTQDQVWLALRLAMARLLLPEGVPLVLDDALLTFDDDRTAAALAVLRREPRQVLLMSCRALQHDAPC